MILNHYNAIKTVLNTSLNGTVKEKNITWYNDQYNRTEEVKGHSWPAVFIEFVQPINWQQTGNGLLTANVDINLHVVMHKLIDDPTALLLLSNDVFKAVNNKAIEENYQLSSELVLSASNLVEGYDNLKANVLTFTTEIASNYGMQELTEVPVKFKVNLEK